MTTKDALAEMAAAAGIETRNTKAGAGIVEEPKFEADALGRFIFTWRDDGVRIVVSNLERRTREFNGYVEAIYRNPQTTNGTKPTRLMSKTRVNLESLTAREGVVRALNRSMDRAWAIRIEQVHAACAEFYQSGEPMVWLAEAAEPGPVVYAARPFVELNQHTIWFGDGSSGKSLLAQALGITIADGVDLIPGIDWRTCPVLYLDWETDRDTHRRRHAGLIRGLKPRDPKRFAYKRMVGPLPDAAEEVGNLVTSNKFGLVIADSVTMASGGDANETATAATYFRAARSICPTWLSIAHVPKNTEGQRPFGSTAWHNLARATWEFTKQQEEGATEFHVLLQHRKGNNTAVEKPRAYKCEFPSDTVMITASAPDAKSGLEKKLGIATRVKSYLLREPMKTAQEIATALDLLETSVSHALTDNDPRIFTRRGDGRPYRWIVVAREQEE